MGAPEQVIVNACAGSVARARRRFESSIEEFHPGDPIAFVEDATEIETLAREAVRRGARRVVAAGGDGTVRAVASALVGTEAVLGILPLGTRNHFARDLGIPPDLDGAERVLSEGRVVAVDVGEVNGRVFVNNSGLGLYPTMVRHREEQQRRGVGKWFAAFRGALRSFAHFRRLSIRVQVDSRHLVRTTPIVFVGNNHYEVEGLGSWSRDCLDAGTFCVYIARHPGRLALLASTLRSLARGLGPGEPLDRLSTEEFWIDTDHRRPHVSLDGEVVRMDRPLHYRIRRRALHVLAAQASS